MEERKRNLKSVSVKTEKRLLNKRVVRQILSENNFDINQSLIIKAMDKTDRGERTVKNMIKEILKEDTE